MTVAELIEELQKLEDKSRDVVFITPDNEKYRFDCAGEWFADYTEIQLLWRDA